VLRPAIEAARDRAHAAVSQTVRSARFRELLIAVTAWADTGAWAQGEVARGPAHDFACRELDKRRHKLLSDGRGLPKATDQQRHRVRIAAKKLRYAAEGFESVFGRKSARRFIDRLRELQDELGALNDIVTAETLLTRLDLPAEAAFAAGELVGLRAADKDRHVTQACESLKRLRRIKPFWN
jgi:CHAD domain-containing protein